MVVMIEMSHYAFDRFTIFFSQIFGITCSDAGIFVAIDSLKFSLDESL